MRGGGGWRVAVALAGIERRASAAAEHDCADESSRARHFSLKPVNRASRRIDHEKRRARACSRSCARSGPGERHRLRLRGRGLGRGDVARRRGGRPGFVAIAFRIRIGIGGIEPCVPKWCGGGGGGPSAPMRPRSGVA